MAVHDADLHFELDDPATATAIAAALEPEIQDGPEGTATKLTVSGSAIDIHIEAADLSGLRAAIMGVVRLLDAAQRMLEHPESF